MLLFTIDSYNIIILIVSGRVLEEHQFWLARVPCICFWIVAWHYPDRVMRQFGLFQVIYIFIQ